MKTRATAGFAPKIRRNLAALGRMHAVSLARFVAAPLAAHENYNIARAVQF